MYMANSFIKIRQKFNNRKIENIENVVLDELHKHEPLVQPESKIAIGLGSRGIFNLPLITKTVVDYLKGKGAKPFILPAMGSHGGANVNGQIEVLKSYGITQQQMGVPVLATMDVVELSAGGLNNKVFMNRIAFESDGIILINRIKPHTDYHSNIESGLIKMSVLGLGSHAQALEIHKFGVYGLKELIPKTAKVVLSTEKIIGGIGIVEDAYDHTMVIRFLESDGFFMEEPELLKCAKENMATLPCKNIDVLIIKTMGKNYSGVGMDSNVIGRIKIRSEKEPAFPNIKGIVVTDITDESHGNALGVGLADVITKRLFDKIDFKATRENVRTSSFLERGKIPLVADTDQQAFDIALRGCGFLLPESARIVCIRNTSNLDELFISKPVYQDIENNRSVEKISDNHCLFDEAGRLIVFEKD